MPYYITNDSLVSIIRQVMYQLVNLIKVSVYQSIKQMNSKILSATPTFDLAVLIKSRFGLSWNFGAQVKLSA